MIEFQILDKFSKFPKLIDESAGFRLVTAQELHMTNDVDKFTSEKTDIPLWEGSLIGHYSQADSSSVYVDPKKWKPGEAFGKSRIVIRTILPNSIRKFYSTVLPPRIAIGNSLVYFVPEQTYEQQYYVAALLNSLLLEYRGKQLISKMTLNQYVIEILPIPRITNSLTETITNLSRDLIKGRIEESKRQETMNMIDALVFKLFGLDIVETKFVLDTFRIDEKEKAKILSFHKSIR